MAVNGSWDIYAQRVGGRNATPIVNDPKRDEGGPAYSPDGTLIAFHESDEDGGIFIAGATGESVRRVTDVGFDPAWSHDGKKIAYSTEEVRDPYARQALSSIYVVDVSGGAPKKISDGDAIEPSWSPSDDRIVYWSNHGGQRDLFTVAATGGTPVPVTNDPALDWSPTWSPDGNVRVFLERSRRRDEPLADRDRSGYGATPRRAAGGHHRCSGLGQSPAIVQGRQASRFSLAGRVGQSGCDSIRSGDEPCRHPGGARRIEQQPDSERRVAGRNTNRLLQRRRASGGRLHQRDGGQGHAPCDRRCPARPRAGLYP